MRIVAVHPTVKQSKLVMIFDVETNGLLNYKKQYSLEDSPYILQLSYAIYDLEQKCLIKTLDSYIKVPNEVVIPEETTKINGITKEMCNNGYPIELVLKEFYKDYHQCSTVIAHNYKFDSSMIHIEFQRSWKHFQHICPYALNLFHPVYMKTANIRYKCTMMDSTNLCKINHPPKPVHVAPIDISTIPLKNNTNNIVVNPVPPLFKQNYKWPSLIELHKHLFGTEPTGMHNSMVDVLVTLRCYLMLEIGNTYNSDDFQALTKDHI